jgi:hypothetical protein
MICFYNYDIALEFGNKEGFVIEDPELNEKLEKAGLKPVKTTPKEIVHEKPEEKQAEEIKEIIADEVEEEPVEEKSEKIEEPKEKLMAEKLEEIRVAYNDKKMPELREIAKKKNINSFGKKKVDLIEEFIEEETKQ